MSPAPDRASGEFFAYTCALCGREFISTTTAEQEAAAAAENYPDVAEEEQVTVCAKCLEAILAHEKN